MKRLCLLLIALITPTSSYALIGPPNVQCLFIHNDKIITSGKCESIPIDSTGSIEGGASIYQGNKIVTVVRESGTGRTIGVYDDDDGPKSGADDMEQLGTLIKSQKDTRCWLGKRSRICIWGVRSG